MRIILEEDVQKINLDKRRDHYINNIIKYCPESLILPKFLQIKKKLKIAFKNNYKKDTDISYIKFCYISQFLNCASTFYDISSILNTNSFNEVYQIIQITQNCRINKLFIYQFQEQKVYWRKAEMSSKFEPAFSIYEISSISILSIENLKTLFCFANQPALTIIFNTIGQMKSFISLLSGYYRLTIHWNVNLSTEYYSPLINRLQKIHCFGPIQIESVRNILKNNRQEQKNFGQFLLKQSDMSFKFLKLYFEKDDQLNCLDIQWKQLENPLFLWKSDLTYIDYSRLSILLSKEKLVQPILASEYESLPDLLLCSKEEATKIKSNDPSPKFIHSQQIQKSILTLQNNGVFCTRIGTVKLSNSQEDRVFIKEFINTNNLNFSQLLKEISEWSKLKNVAILNCKFILMDPLTVLFEHCHITLRDYYSTQEFKLSHVNLTEAAFLLAKAIDYLYTQNLIHGYIKFDNLFVSYFNKSSLYVKLGDRIGFFCRFDNNKEQPWLPPEYFDENGFFYKKHTSYSDVWAFGTTIWEIFHHGNHPEFNHSVIEYANLDGMPDSMKLLVKKCWNKNFYNRIHPSGVFRELVLILTRLYDERKCNNQYISNDIYDPKTIVENKSYYRRNKKNLNGYQKRLSISYSLDEESTDMTDFDQDAFMISETDEILHMQAMNDLEYIPKETISVLKLIGKVN